MSTLTEKAKQLVETVAVKGGIEVGVNFATGAIKLNGIDFTVTEQMELISTHRNDPTMNKIFAELKKTPEAQAVKNTVSFNSGNFEVNKEQVEKTFGIKLEDLLPPTSAPKEGSGSVTILDDKDREIIALKAELATVKALITDDTIYEEGLEFPNDFYCVHEDETLLAPIKELSEDEVQSIIDELKTVEVAEGSFVTHQLGDTVVIKLNGEGISYIVSNDYYVANVE